MDFKTLQNIVNERQLTKKELKKREEIAQAIERENPGIDMSKKMAIATAQAKKCCEEEELNEISKYDLFVTYMRHIGMDPYKLRGPAGSALRTKIKESPAFQTWVKQQYGESVESLDEKFAGKSVRDVHKELLNMGFEAVGQTGSHRKYKHPKSSHPDNMIIIPQHKTDVDPNILRTAMKKANAVASSITESKVEKLLSASKKSKEKIAKPAEPFIFLDNPQDQKDNTKEAPAVSTDSR